jgi:hypothetical protein
MHEKPPQILLFQSQRYLRDFIHATLAIFDWQVHATQLGEFGCSVLRQLFYWFQWNCRINRGLNRSTRQGNQDFKTA